MSELKQNMGIKYPSNFFNQTTNKVSKTTSKSQVKIISLRVVLASAAIGKLPPVKFVDVDVLQVGVETPGGFALHRKSVVLHPRIVNF